MINNNKEERILEIYARDYENDPEFVAERLAIKLTEEMLECLERKEKTQSWLAEQMGVTRAHISSILNARPNMTLLTIAKIAVALDVEPDISLDTEPWRLSKINSVSTVQEELDIIEPSRMNATSELYFGLPPKPKDPTTLSFSATTS